MKLSLRHKLATVPVAATTWVVRRILALNFSQLGGASFGRLKTAFEKTNIVGAPAVSNSRVPFAPLLVKTHADISRSIVALNGLIATVVRRAGDPQFRNSIVGPHAEPVVNLAGPILSVNVQPSENVGVVLPPVRHFDLNVPVMRDGSSRLPRISSVPSFGTGMPRKPSENANCGIVTQNVANVLSRKWRKMLHVSIPSGSPRRDSMAAMNWQAFVTGG